MASRVWLLVKWINETRVLPEYGVTYVNTSDYDKEDLKPATVISFSVDNERPRPAKILLVSDNKRDIEEQKVMQERQDKTINDIIQKFYSQKKDVASTSRSLQIERSQYRNVQKPKCHGSRQKYKKIFVDQETQTEDEDFVPKVYPLMKNLVRKVIKILKKWDENNLNHTNTNNTRSQHHEEESYIEHNVSESCLEPNKTESDRQGDMIPAEIADVGAEEVVEDSAENHTSNSSIRETEENLYPTDPLVRTADTTHKEDYDEDLVPIGNGKTQVSRRLLQEIDWNSYTTATRQLLLGVFPRKVLATSCLTGKKSPAFLNRPAKKLLDPVKVDDIVTTVATKCGVPRNIVRGSITIKCTDEAKLHRKRQKDRLARMSLHQTNENIPSTTPSLNETVASHEANLHRNRQQGMCPRLSLHQNDENIAQSTASSHETVAPHDASLNRNRQQGMRPRTSLHQTGENIRPSTPSYHEIVAPHEAKLHRHRQQGMRPRRSLDQNDENIPPSTSSSDETVAPHDAKLLRNRLEGKRPRIYLHQSNKKIPPSSDETVTPHEAKLHRNQVQAKRPRMSLHKNDENIPPRTPSSDETVAPHEAKLHRNQLQGKRPRMSLHQNDETISPSTPSSDEIVAPHEANSYLNRQQGKRPRMSLLQNDENIPPIPSSDETVIQVKHPPNMSRYQNEENIPPLTPPSDDTLAAMD